MIIPPTIKKQTFLRSILRVFAFETNPSERMDVWKVNRRYDYRIALSVQSRKRALHAAPCLQYDDVPYVTINARLMSLRA